MFSPYSFYVFVPMGMTCYLIVPNVEVNGYCTINRVGVVILKMSENSHMYVTGLDSDLKTPKMIHIQICDFKGPYLNVGVCYCFQILTCAWIIHRKTCVKIVA